MNDDFITGLRGDLVGAMDRYEDRRPAARAAKWLRGAGLRPLVAVVAAAAAVVVVAVGVQHLPQPEQTPAKLSGIGHIGGVIVDAAAAGDSLWIGGYEGRVSHVDTRSGRLERSVATGAQLQRLAASGDVVWAQGEFEHLHRGVIAAKLVRIDARAGRVTGRFTIRGGESLVATATAVWAASQLETTDDDAVDRIDARTGHRTATIRIAGINGLAAGADAVWAVTTDGTVVRIDARTARVTRRWPRIAPPADDNGFTDHVLVPEEGGAWVLSTGREAILHIVGDRVVRVIAVGAVRPLLARTSGSLWVTSGDGIGGHNRLRRIDEATGEVTQTLELGDRQPQTLVAAGDALSVITTAGDVLRVR